MRDLSLQPPSTLCISVGATGVPGDRASFQPSISANGRVLAFASLATNLVPAGDPEQPAGCANAVAHVFRHDRDAGPGGDTDCVTVNPNGIPADDSSFNPFISGNGNVIVFVSAATNLLGDLPVGASAVLAAGDGLSVAQILRSDAFRRTMEQMSQVEGQSGDRPSRVPSTNFDGMVVAFQSAATNFMESDTNDSDDVFVVRVRTPAPAPPAFTLTVVLAGGGSGAVTSAPVVGINCPSDCEELYAGGTVVTLRATAGAGSIFAGWSGGGCGGTGDCLVTVAGPTPVTATFEAAPGRVLTVRVVGEGGTVTSAPAGIECPPACVAAFPPGTTVTLTARLAPGGTFGGWSGGGCGGTELCVVTLGDALEVTARFAPPGRVIITNPADGTHFPGGQIRLSVTWTALPGAPGTQYGLEHTGPNLVFHNRNGADPDPVSGFGGLGGGFVLPTPSFAVDLDASALPAGLYQVRVIPLVPGGTFSNAVTLRFGPLGSEQPRVTSPPDRFAAVREVTDLVLAWTAVSGAADYLLEVSARNAVFTNPEGGAPDPQNGFGGAGLGFSFAGTTVGPVRVPGTFLPGTYQVRVLPRAPNGEFIGLASAAITLEIR